ncbi:hypothetical protein CANARDRAFT_23984 [[Candida] arabinofermentans NRRL YB-2248]|uniref:Uncharacterized protein n=1 Tax=[Candida] arabinofermentans NRRL YB-2248 TaxID=983967 RepID=A0A1E4SYM0_9ASCO|nr:hypothetical protein CANARDRAFT_23984 [[Candida] arabinofermentans NRRL YB-2248]
MNNRSTYDSSRENSLDFSGFNRSRTPQTQLDIEIDKPPHVADAADLSSTDNSDDEADIQKDAPTDGNAFQNNNELILWANKLELESIDFRSSAKKIIKVLTKNTIDISKTLKQNQLNSGEFTALSKEINDKLEAVCEANKNLSKQIQQTERKNDGKFNLILNNQIKIMSAIEQQNNTREDLSKTIIHLGKLSSKVNQLKNAGVVGNAAKRNKMPTTEPQPQRRSYRRRKPTATAKLVEEILGNNKQNHPKAQSKQTSTKRKGKVQSSKRSVKTKQKKTTIDTPKATRRFLLSSDEQL